MKKSIYALFMFVALLVGQQTQAQEKEVLYSAEYVEISENWTQEGDIVENLWSLQSNCYAAYAFNANDPITNYLVSPAITLKSSNDVTFDHIVYNSLFGNVEEEAQLVIREIGGSWVKIEGVHYPSGYDPENSGILAIPEEYNNKEVQFALQYKKTAENTGLWGIVNFTVAGMEGAAPDPQPEAGETIYSAVMFDEFANWTQEGDYAGESLWAPMEGIVVAYGYMATGETTSYLVSPKMTLDAGGNKVSFTHEGWYFGDITEEAQLVIREIGGEWVKIEGVVYPEEGTYDFVNSGELAIPAQFNGKEVQVAFQYKCNNETIGLWGLKEIKVEKGAASEPDENLALYKIYNEPFIEGFAKAGYTVEGEQGEPDTPLWFDRDGWVTANANYRIGDRTNIESYLVSPEIQLGKDNTVRFFHMGSLFNSNMAESVSLWVRENGGEWVAVEGLKYGSSYEEVNSGDLAIPAQFNGKKVQFGFKYTAPSGTEGGCWQIRDVVVKGYLPKKAEAGISFDVTEVKYEIGSGDFESPVINNPNNLKIYYSSENENVAIIDEDGIVTIIGQGTTLIRALSPQTEEYEKGEASYTITVTDPNVVFSADFMSGNCDFTEESTCENDAWMEGWDSCIMADAYCKTDVMTDFYFISPIITLSENGNILSFEHNGVYFTNWEEQAQLVIREAYTDEWEQLTIPTYPVDGNWVNSGDIIIPEKFNGMEVEIAFKYASDGMQNCGMWYVRNLVIRKSVPTSIEGVSVEIQDNKVYDLQGRRVDNPSNGIFIINGKKVIIK